MKIKKRKTKNNFLNSLEKHRKSIGIYTLIGIFVVLGMFSILQTNIDTVKAGSINGQTIRPFENDVTLTTVIKKDATVKAGPMFNKYGTSSLMGLPPGLYSDYGNVNTIASGLGQGDVVTVEVNLTSTSAANYTTIIGKGKFFSGDNTPFDLVPIGTCTASVSGTGSPSAGTCSYSNDVLTFGGFDTDGITRTRTYTFQFLIGEQLPPTGEIFLRLDYTANGVPPTNDLNIANGSCGHSGVSKSNPANEPMAPCMTSPPADTQGYMNFKFEISDSTAPNLYLDASNTTVGLPDIDPDSIAPLTALGFQNNTFPPNGPEPFFPFVNQDNEHIIHTSPTYDTNRYPSLNNLSRYFDAGVIRTGTISMDTIGTFDGGLPGFVDNTAHPEHFRDDAGLLLAICKSDLTTCEEVNKDAIDTQEVALPQTHSASVSTSGLPGATSGSATVSYNNYYPNDAPIHIDFNWLDTNSPTWFNKGTQAYLVISSIDHLGNVQSYPIFYNFKYAAPPVWDISDHYYIGATSEDGSFTSEELDSHVSYYTDEPTNPDALISFALNTGNTGNFHIPQGALEACIDNFSIFSNNDDGDLDDEYYLRYNPNPFNPAVDYQCAGDWEIRLRVNDKDHPDIFNSFRWVDFTVDDAPDIESIKFNNISDPAHDPEWINHDDSTVSLPPSTHPAIDSGNDLIISPYYEKQPQDSFTVMRRTTPDEPVVVYDTDQYDNDILFYDSGRNQYYYEILYSNIQGGGSLFLYNFNLHSKRLEQLLTDNYTNLTNQCENQWPAGTISTPAALITAVQASPDDYLDCIIDNAGAYEYWDDYVQIDIAVAAAPPDITGITSISQLAIGDTSPYAFDYIKGGSSTCAPGSLVYDFNISTNGNYNIQRGLTYNSIVTELSDFPGTINLPVNNTFPRVVFCDSRDLSVTIDGAADPETTYFTLKHVGGSARQIDVEDIDYVPPMINTPTGNVGSTTEYTVNLTIDDTQAPAGYTNPGTDKKVQVSFVLLEDTNGDTIYNDELELGYDYEATINNTPATTPATGTINWYPENIADSLPSQTFNIHITELDASTSGRNFQLQFFGRDRYDNQTVLPTTHNFYTPSANLVAVQFQNPGTGDIVTEVIGNIGENVSLNIMGQFYGIAQLQNLLDNPGEYTFITTDNCNGAATLDTSNYPATLTLNSATEFCILNLQVNTPNNPTTLLQIIIHPPLLESLIVRHGNDDYVNNGTLQMPWKAGYEDFELWGVFSDGEERILVDEDKTDASFDITPPRYGELEDTSGSTITFRYTFDNNYGSYTERWHISFTQNHATGSHSVEMGLNANITLEPPETWYVSSEKILDGGSITITDDRIYENNDTINNAAAQNDFYVYGNYNRDDYLTADEILVNSLYSLSAFSSSIRVSKSGMSPYNKFSVVIDCPDTSAEFTVTYNGCSGSGCPEPIMLTINRTLDSLPDPTFIPNPGTLRVQAGTDLTLNSYVSSNVQCPLTGVTVTYYEGGTLLCTATPNIDGIYSCTKLNAYPGTSETTHTIKAIANKSGLPSSPGTNTFQLEVDGVPPQVVADSLTYNAGFPLPPDTNTSIEDPVYEIKALIDKDFDTSKSQVAYTMSVCLLDGGACSSTIPAITKTGVTTANGVIRWSTGTPLVSGDYELEINLTDKAGNDIAGTFTSSFNVSVSNYRVNSFTANPAGPVMYASIPDTGVSFALNIAGSGINRVELWEKDSLWSSEETPFSPTIDTGIISANQWSKVGGFTGSTGTITVPKASFALSGDFETHYYAVAVITSNGTAVRALPLNSTQTVITSHCTTGTSIDDTCMAQSWPHRYMVDDRDPGTPKLEKISTMTLEGLGTTPDTPLIVNEPEDSLTPRFMGHFIREGQLGNVPHNSLVRIKIYEHDTNEEIANTDFHVYEDIEGSSYFDWNYVLSNNSRPLFADTLYQAVLSTRTPSGVESGTITYYFKINSVPFAQGDTEQHLDDDEYEDVCTKLADGTEYCELTVQIRDKYGNYIDGIIRDDENYPIVDQNAFDFNFDFPTDVYTDSGNSVENPFNIYVDYTGESAPLHTSIFTDELDTDGNPGNGVQPFDEDDKVFKYVLVTIAPSVDTDRYLNTLGGRIINNEYGVEKVRELDIKVAVRVDNDNISPSRNTRFFHDDDAAPNDISEGNELVYGKYFGVTDGTPINCEDYNVAIDDDHPDNDGNGIVDKYELCQSLIDMNTDIAAYSSDEKYRNDTAVVVEKTADDTDYTGFLIFSPLWQYVRDAQLDLIPTIMAKKAVEVEIDHMLYSGGTWIPEVITNNTVTINKQAPAETFRLVIRNNSAKTIYFASPELGVDTFAQFIGDVAAFQNIQVDEDRLKIVPFTDNGDGTYEYLENDPTAHALSSYIVQQGAEQFALGNIGNGLGQGKAIVVYFTADLGFNENVLEANGFFDSTVKMQIADSRYFAEQIVHPGLVMVVNLINTGLSLDIPGLGSTDDDVAGMSESDIYDAIKVQFERYGQAENQGTAPYGQPIVDLVNPNTGQIDFEQFYSNAPVGYENVYTSNNKTVLYVKNLNVLIKDPNPNDGVPVTAPAGLTTLMVTGGNVIIESDIYPADDTKGFGIMVAPEIFNTTDGTADNIPVDQWLETKYNEFVQGGNVLVASGEPESPGTAVTDLHAHFFIQGAMLNLDSDAASEMSDAELGKTSSLYELLTGTNDALPIVFEPVPALAHQLYIEGVLVAIQNTLNGSQNNEPYAEIENAEVYDQLLDFGLFRIFTLIDGFPRVFNIADDQTITSEYSNFCKSKGSTTIPPNGNTPAEAYPACSRAVIIERGKFEAPPGFKELPTLEWGEITGHGGDLSGGL